MCVEDGCLPGLFFSSFLSIPWLSDKSTIILSSFWRSNQVILSVNVLSGQVSRISPADSSSSWSVLALDGDNIIAVCSSPIDVPQIKYGYLVEKASASATWSWLDISSSIPIPSEKVRTMLSSLQFSIMKIPIRGASDSLTADASSSFIEKCPEEGLKFAYHLTSQ